MATEIQKPSSSKAQGKPKPTPKPKSLKPSAAPVSLERVDAATVVPVVPDGVSDAFLKKAQQLDGKIVDTIARIGKDLAFLGEAFNEMQAKGYHTALGFSDMRSYIKARWPDSLNPTTVFQAMRITRELTMGENPVLSHEDVREMTASNAEGLAQLKKAGHEITPALIQEAKVLPISRFQAEIVLPRIPEQAQRAAVSRGLHIEEAPEITVKRMVTFTGEVEALRVQCFEICRYVLREDAEDTPLLKTAEDKFENRVYAAVFAEFIATHAAEFEELKAAEARQTVLRAQSIAAKMGEDSRTIEGNFKTLEATVAPVPQAPKDGAQASEAAPKDILLDAGERPQCAFIKPNLKQCTHPAVDDSRYCGTHKKKGEAIDAAAAAEEAALVDQSISEDAYIN